MPEAPVPTSPRWTLCPWIGLLCLTAALPVGVVAGSVVFIRWRHLVNAKHPLAPAPFSGLVWCGEAASV